MTLSDPTDAEILAAVRKWGNRTTTSMVRSVLSQQFKTVIKTPWVLRQLKRLEREGKVQRVSSSYVVQLCWSAAA